VKGFDLLCWVCFGDGCENCDHGKNYVDEFVMDTVTQDGAAFFKQYQYLKNYSIFPRAGGLMDQDAKFIRCVDYCDLINLRLEKIKEAKSNEIKKMARAINAK